jgi:VIT1/CCC1 family predicted Fe2+/Mn2+ transporter
MMPRVYRPVLDDVLHHTREDPHRRAASLSDFILGAQDGLVNVLGVILGIAAATEDARLVLVAGLATTFAESISMGAVAYTTTLAEADLYQSELEREYRHIREIPALEKREVKEIYSRKGFTGNLLQRIVDTVTANKDVWVAVMMAEEHQLMPVDRRAPLRAAWIVGISAVLGSLVPLLPFLLLPVRTSMLAAVLVTAAVLFGIGSYKARVTVGHPGRSGLEMALIGTIAAMAGYIVGTLLKVPPQP